MVGPGGGDERDDLQVVWVAAGLGHCLAQPGDAVGQRAAAGRDPALGELGDVREHGGGGGAADEDRQRALGRLGPGPGGGERDVLPAELGYLFLPEAAHRQDVLAEPRAAGRRVDAVVVHLFDVPAVADPYREAAARLLVDGGQGLGGDDGVALCRQQDAGSEPDSGRDRGRHRQGGQRVEEVQVAVGELAAERVGRLTGDRDVGVVRYPESVKAAFLDRAGHVGDAEAAVGRDHRDAVPQRCLRHGIGTEPVSSAMDSCVP